MRGVGMVGTADVKSSSGRVQWLVWGMMGLACLVIAGAYARQELRERGWVGGEAPPVLGTLADFQLTNQLGQVVTLGTLRGQVAVFDIIFTRCPGPCALITRHMAALQRTLSPQLPVRFVSLTTDAEHDTPEVLRAYGERFGVDPGRHLFLTGSRQEIHRVATSPQGGLMLAVVDKAVEERVTEGDLFVHSTKFVVVDGRGQIRGYFDGERPEAQMGVVAMVRRLVREGKE